MKRWIIIALCLLLVGCGTTAKKTTEEVQKHETPSITVVVNSTERTSVDQWDELKDGYELAVVDITVTNNGEESYEFNPNYLALQHDNNNISCSDKRPKGKDVLTSYTIEPGESLAGIICFEIPIGTEYNLFYDDFNNQIKL